MSGALKVDKRTGKLKVSEADIERTCTEILELDGWRALKTEPVSDRGRGKGFGELGMADMLYIRYNRTGLGLNGYPYAEILWIEWKAKGGRLSNNQSVWHDQERRRGALTLIAGYDFPASIEGFREYYKSSGLMSRNV